MSYTSKLKAALAKVQPPTLKQAVQIGAKLVARA